MDAPRGGEDSVRAWRGWTGWGLYVAVTQVLFWGWWPVALSAIGVWGIFALRRSPRNVPLVIFLSPFILVPTLSFLWGVGSYVAGSAHLMTYGLPGPEFHNLDRKLRCGRSSSG